MVYRYVTCNFLIFRTLLQERSTASRFTTYLNISVSPFLVDGVQDGINLVCAMLMIALVLILFYCGYVPVKCGENSNWSIKRNAVRDPNWYETATISGIRSGSSCGYLREPIDKSLTISYGCIASVPLQSGQFREWAHTHQRLTKENPRRSPPSSDQKEMTISFQMQLTILNANSISKKWEEFNSQGVSSSLPPLEKVSVTLIVGIGGGAFPITIYPFTDMIMRNIDPINFESRIDIMYKHVDRHYESIAFNVGWLVDSPVTSESNNELFLSIEPQLIDHGLMDLTIPIDEQALFLIKTIRVEYVPPPLKFHLERNDVLSSLSSGFDAIDKISQTGNNSAIRENCRLFGTPDAVILHRIKISSKAFQKSDHHSLTELLNERQLSLGKAEDHLPLRMRSRNSAIIDLPRLFCGIFTIAKHHSSNVKAMKDTWAKKCLSFLAFSTIDDPDIPSINIPHLGPESYMNMWQKTRSIWKYIHNYYLDEFEYFLLGGDDMYYIMENLYAFLLSQRLEEALHSNTALYMGRKFQYLHNNNQSYNTGGPGYILNRIAVEKLVAALDSEICNPHLMHSIEDVLIADCFQKQSPPIFPYDTSDDRTKQRFHYFSPGYLLDPFDNNDVAEEMKWVKLSDPTPAYGLNCCSNTSIAFHYIAPNVMYEIDDFLYRCPREAVARSFAERGEGFFSPEHKIVAQKKAVVTPH